MTPQFPRVEILDFFFFAIDQVCREREFSIAREQHEWYVETIPCRACLCMLACTQILIERAQVRLSCTLQCALSSCRARRRAPVALHCCATLLRHICCVAKQGFLTLTTLGFDTVHGHDIVHGPDTVHGHDNVHDRDIGPKRAFS